MTCRSAATAPELSLEEAAKRVSSIPRAGGAHLGNWDLGSWYPKDCCRRLVRLKGFHQLGMVVKRLTTVESQIFLVSCLFGRLDAARKFTLQLSWLNCSLMREVVGNTSVRTKSSVILYPGLFQFATQPLLYHDNATVPYTRDEYERADRWRSRPFMKLLNKTIVEGHGREDMPRSKAPSRVE